jgi:hypothetical protein
MDLKDLKDPEKLATYLREVEAKKQALNEGSKQAQEIELKAFSRPARRAQQRTPLEPPIQLPFWKEVERVAPSAIFRSAIFAATKGQKKFHQRAILASWKGVEIRFTGLQLNQGDLDAWLQALHTARHVPAGKMVSFTARSFLKALGKNAAGKTTHERLKETFARLTGCVVEITVGPKTYGEHLIERFCRNEETGCYELALNRSLVKLFDTPVTRFEWETRKSLQGDMSKWLLGYVMSHRATSKNLHRIGVLKLRELCGSECKELFKFRQNLRSAMEQLAVAGVVEEWGVSDTDCLFFARTGAGTQ